MPLEYNKAFQCVVVVDGKEEVRTIARLAPNLSGGPPLPVPVLREGEEVTYDVDGSIHIHRV